MKILLRFLFYGLVASIGVLSTTLSGHSQAPRLTGTVTVGLSAGSISGNVCLGNVPAVHDTLTVVLNHAFTITSVTGVEAEPAAVGSEPGDGGTILQYAGGAIRSAEGGPVGDICLTYSGTFPTYDVAAHRFRDDDSSHVIAFNGSAVRARGVSRWHPTPLDPRTGLVYEAVAFDLELKCVECDLLYLNAGEPQRGPVARFRADLPREALLVAGDLNATIIGGITYIDPALAPDSAARFSELLHEIAAALETDLGVPYGPLPEIVNLTSVRAPRKGQLWGFFSDPALVLIGMSIPELLSTIEESSGRGREVLIGFLAHELAHRYFGWTVGTASPQRDLFGEPFATYLEVRTIRRLLGEEAYRRAAGRLGSGGSWATGLATLDQATAEEFAIDRYRYSYAPGVLLALEAAVGEDVMRRTMRALLLSEGPDLDRADFRYLVDLVRAAGGSEEAIERWLTECVATGVGSGCLAVASRG